MKRWCHLALVIFTVNPTRRIQGHLGVHGSGFSMLVLVKIFRAAVDVNWCLTTRRSLSGCGRLFGPRFQRLTERPNKTKYHHRGLVQPTLNKIRINITNPPQCSKLPYSPNRRQIVPRKRGARRSSMPLFHRVQLNTKLQVRTEAI